MEDYEWVLLVRWGVIFPTLIIAFDTNIPFWSSLCLYIVLFLTLLPLKRVDLGKLEGHECVPLVRWGVIFFSILMISFRTVWSSLCPSKFYFSLPRTSKRVDSKKLERLWVSCPPPLPPLFGEDWFPYLDEGPVGARFPVLSPPFALIRMWCSSRGREQRFRGHELANSRQQKRPRCSPSSPLDHPRQTTQPWPLPGIYLRSFPHLRKHPDIFHRNLDLPISATEWFGDVFVTFFESGDGPPTSSKPWVPDSHSVGTT